MLTFSISSNTLYLSHTYRLTEGYSAETSGGIFCMLDKATAKDFQKELYEVYGQQSWIVGDVVKAEGKEPQAKIRKDVEIITIKDSFVQN